MFRDTTVVVIPLSPLFMFLAIYNASTSEFALSSVHPSHDFLLNLMPSLIVRTKEQYHKIDDK